MHLAMAESVAAAMGADAERLAARLHLSADI